MRSAAWDLLSNRADDDEVKAAIKGELVAALPIALRGTEQELQPADPMAITVELGKIVGIIGQDWTREGRAEFIALVGSELMKYPGGLVLDALSRARGRVTVGRILLNWVIEDVEPKADRLKRELAQIRKLTELAG